MRPIWSPDSQAKAQEEWKAKLVASESELRAREISCTNAINRKGTNCKPQLWVYEGQGNFKTLQKTKATELIEGTKRAGWEGESFCVSLQPRIDRRVCFDLRDAGGATSPARWGSRGSIFRTRHGSYRRHTMVVQDQSTPVLCQRLEDCSKPLPESAVRQRLAG